MGDEKWEKGEIAETILELSELCLVIVDRDRTTCHISKREGRVACGMRHTDCSMTDTYLGHPAD